MAGQLPIPEPSGIISFMTILADVLRLWVTWMHHLIPHLTCSRSPEETLAMAFMYMNRYKKYYRTSEEIDFLDAHVCHPPNV
jgi:hypothetical protein